MTKMVNYKDKMYYIGFFIDIVMSRFTYLFNVDLEDEKDKVYKLTFMTENNDNSNNKYAIDIYINSDQKDILFNSINNIFNGSEELIELSFENKIDKRNRVYYKLSQFINTECFEFLNMIMKLKIYRDKNFVIIEPKVSYTYLPITIKDLDINICPVLLSENTIEEIKQDFE